MRKFEITRGKEKKKGKEAEEYDDVIDVSISISLFLCPFDRPYQPSLLHRYHHSFIQSTIDLLNNERTIAPKRKSSSLY